MSPSQVLDPSVLQIARIGTDSGMLVLIWLVQSIIYPSFRYTRRQSLASWHARYMGLISRFVAPLMILQAVAVGLQLQQPNAFSVASATLVIAAWASTFAQAVPAHRALTRIATATLDPRPYVDRLVRANVHRAVFWTGVWLLAVVDLLA